MYIVTNRYILQTTLNQQKPIFTEAYFYIYHLRLTVIYNIGYYRTEVASAALREQFICHGVRSKSCHLVLLFQIISTNSSHGKETSEVLETSLKFRLIE